MKSRLVILIIFLAMMVVSMIQQLTAIARHAESIQKKEVNIKNSIRQNAVEMHVMTDEEMRNKMTEDEADYSADIGVGAILLELEKDNPFREPATKEDL